MKKCQFHLYDQFFNGFDDTPQCQKIGVRRFLFCGDLRVPVFCEDHFQLVEKQTIDKEEEDKKKK